MFSTSLPTRRSLRALPNVARLFMQSGVLLALLVASLSAYAQAQAPRIYAYNGANRHLVSFSADAPGTLLSDIAIVGLVNSEHVVGMDFVPRGEELHAVLRDGNANTSRLVRIDRDSGALTNLPTSLTLAGGTGYFGVSYSGADGDMYITNGISNITVAPNAGIGALTRTPYAFTPGDVGFGLTPFIPSIAHTRSSGLSQLNTMYGISFGSGALPMSLVRIGGVASAPSQTSGQVFTVGPLGPGTISGEGYGGFDIQAGTNIGYASLRIGSTLGTPANHLFTVNLATGAATFIGVIGSPGAGTRIDSIAIAPPSQCLDIDGDGVVLPTTDGLLLMRILLGMTGQAVFNGAQPTPAANRVTWATLREHLNTKCGMNLSP
jgi:trimeric autotransporter adhesin